MSERTTTPSGRRRPPRLPGDPTPRALVERMIRVDHAGEYGAVRIYEGQLVVLGRGPAAAAVRAMHAQEKEHLARFDRLIAERRVRPTALMPLWHLAGFVLGAGSALLGDKAAMACTVAVEEVIDQHYARQVAGLPEEEAELKATFARFREDEIAHRDVGLAHGATTAPGYAAFTALIKTGSRLAIWFSERI